MAHFAAVHDRLRDILRPYGDRLAITRDGPGGMALEIPAQLTARGPAGYEAKAREMAATHH